MSAGNVKLHRSLGTWGIAHATVVLLTGLLIQLIASRAGMVAGRAPGTDGLYLGILAAIGFSLMFTLAIRNTGARDPQADDPVRHAPGAAAGVNRFWFNALGLDDPISNT